jgi:hypothetical protein
MKTGSSLVIIGDGEAVAIANDGLAQGSSHTGEIRNRFEFRSDKEQERYNAETVFGSNYLDLLAARP